MAASESTRVPDTNNRDAFQERLHRQRSRILASIRHIVPDVNAREDIVQEVCLRALQYRSSFKDVNLIAWLCAIARNVAIDEQRRSRSRPLCFSEMPAYELERICPGDDLPLDNTQDDFRNHVTDMIHLQNQLQRLPKEQRLVFTWRELDGDSDDRIAHRLGYSVGNVRVLACRARKTLQRHLAHSSGPNHVRYPDEVKS